MSEPSLGEILFGFIAASESAAFLIAFFPVNNTKFNLRIMLDFIKCCWHKSSCKMVSTFSKAAEPLFH